jgi:hypothetical protein
MLIAVLRLPHLLRLLLVIACSSAQGQSLSSQDSTLSKQVLRQAFLRNGEWLNANDQAGRCYFSTKRQAKSAVDHLRIVPVRYLEFQRFQAYRVGQALAPYYVSDPHRQVGLLPYGGQVISALHLVPLHGPGKRPVLFVDNADFRLALAQVPPGAELFFESYYRTYAYFQQQEVYVLDLQVNRFRRFEEFVGGPEGIAALQQRLRKH